MDIKDMSNNYSETIRLKEENERLKKEILRLHKTLEEYGVGEFSPITDIEVICTKGIKDLGEVAEAGMLSESDTKILDILHKNLRLARAEFKKKELKGKETKVADLLKIVEGNK